MMTRGQPPPASPTTPCLCGINVLCRQGRAPAACHTTFWVTAGLSWLIWMFAVSAASAGSWFCADDIGCAGLDAYGDLCEDFPDLDVCGPREKKLFLVALSPDFTLVSYI